MDNIEQRVKTIENNLQLRIPGSSFSRQLSEKYGEPCNWVFGVGEINMPKVFFVSPSMVKCIELAERYFAGFDTLGLHITRGFCGCSYKEEDFIT